MGSYIPLLILLLIIAALMRDDFALTLVYLVVGAFALGAWWNRTSLAQVEHGREFSDHAFLGEKVHITLRIRNRGWLPVLWVNVQDTLPVALSGTPSYQHVLSLGPHAERHFRYSVEARKRGYYPIGPLFTTGGDILGMGGPTRLEGGTQYLTVYPQIVPLSSVEIPSRSPQGSLRHNQPVFEDPSRVFGKREYIVGDSLRRVDWKSSATTGQLQVKLFEPSIALETLIFLNLNAEDYHYRNRIDSTELAIVIAASIAAWVAEKHQTFGIKINGRDPLMPDGVPQYLPPRKGQGQLMRILETLARIEMTEENSFTAMLQQQRYHLSWGTTLIVITEQAGDALLDELHQARRAGQNAMLVLAGLATYAGDVTERARHFGIPVVSIPNERGLDLWRR